MITVGPLQEVIRKMVAEPKGTGFSIRLAYGHTPGERNKGMREVAEVVGVTERTLYHLLARPPPLTDVPRSSRQVGGHPRQAPLGHMGPRLVQGRSVRWEDRAKCKDHPNPDFFFPDGPGRVPKNVLAYCNDCPVKGECLEWALAAPPHIMDHGVYGGTSEHERQRIRRERNAA